MMGHLTKIENTPSTHDVVPGMAHFANTGPAGKTCLDCKFWAPAADGGVSYYSKSGGHGGAIKDHRCQRYREMMQGAWGAKIPARTASCKYFDQSPSPPSKVVKG